MGIGGGDMPGCLEALGMVLKHATTCRRSVMGVWAVAKLLLAAL